MSDRIPIIIPDVSFEEVESDLRKVFGSGQLTSGPFVVEFEKAIAEWTGVEYAVATTSATTALHLALAALDVGPGDEVLLSDFTFPATANVVVQTGATPVLVDSSATDFAMDPELARDLVSDRTRVVMPVDPFGQPADHGAICALAADVGARVVVDAACSLGGERFGAACGAHGDMGCFSFHPRKVVTCGEGGMVTTSDPDLVDRLRILRNHGSRRTGTRSVSFVEPGFNYRLGEVAAVMGLAQVRRLGSILADRRTTASHYDATLEGVLGLTVPRPASGTKWSYQSYVVVLDDGIDRDGIISAMADVGIETTIGTYACHQHPAYAPWGYRDGDLPNSARFARQALTLPLIPRMSTAQVERVVGALVTALDSG
jgi:dTDP-4-amino-4,6-dideoxygalactose transaminase